MSTEQIQQFLDLERLQVLDRMGGFVIAKIPERLTEASIPFVEFDEELSEEEYARVNSILKDMEAGDRVPLSEIKLKYGI